MEKKWVAIVENKTKGSRYNFLCDADFSRSNGMSDADLEKAKTIRASYPELKGARIRAYRYDDSLLSTIKMNKLDLFSIYY